MIHRRQVVSGMAASAVLVGVSPVLSEVAVSSAPIAALSDQPNLREAIDFVWSECRLVASNYYGGDIFAARFDLAAACTRLGDHNQPRWPFVACPLYCYDQMHRAQQKLYVTQMRQAEISEAFCYVRDSYLCVPVSALPRNPLNANDREMIKRGFSKTG